MGLWLTEYTSTWLKDAYHIGAPYVDTRHNEAVGRFLQEAAHTLGLRALMEADIPYADFLVEQRGPAVSSGWHPQPTFCSTTTSPGGPYRPMRP